MQVPQVAHTLFTLAFVKAIHTSLCNSLFLFFSSRPKHSTVSPFALLFFSFFLPIFIYIFLIKSLTFCPSRHFSLSCIFIDFLFSVDNLEQTRLFTENVVTKKIHGFFSVFHGTTSCLKKNDFFSLVLQRGQPGAHAALPRQTSCPRGYLGS
jgi:hypothetical protein